MKPFLRTNTSIWKTSLSIGSELLNLDGLRTMLFNPIRKHCDVFLWQYGIEDADIIDLALERLH